MRGVDDCTDNERERVHGSLYTVPGIVASWRKAERQNLLSGKRHDKPHT